MGVPAALLHGLDLRQRGRFELGEVIIMHRRGEGVRIVMEGGEVFRASMRSSSCR